MSSTGLLVVTNPSKLARILPIIQQHYVNKTLYVQYYPGCRQLLVPSPAKEFECRPVGLNRGKHIIGLYAQANELCGNLDVRILLQEAKYPHVPVINTLKKIQVVIFDCPFDADEVSNFSRNRLGNVSEKCQSITLDDSEELKAEDSTRWCDTVSQETEVRTYENVVLGGTFDRLHAGHKTMLSEAVLRCTSQLTVGVTDTPMLKSKTLWELIEPCCERIKSLHEFLQDIDPQIKYNIVPIVDPFGPTKDDPSFQMIVVSAETLKGGKAVNELRTKNGLSTLDIHVVELLTSKDTSRVLPEENEEEKVSSSNHRLRLLGTRLKKPTPKPSLPARPYIIGLTGGIASGKTHVGEYLASLGAGVIVCDSLGHDLYRRGQPLYDLIVKEFGEQVVDPEGAEINRRALGGLVFQDSTRLERLNQLVWPALLGRVKTEIQLLHRSGHTVVVVEAALLVKAGWADECHEIWTCIIPEAEAVKRQMERNAFTAEEAHKRVAMQPSNTAQVRDAHIVFSTLWSREYTERQVKRAWTLLQEELTYKCI